MKYVSACLKLLLNEEPTLNNNSCYRCLCYQFALNNNTGTHGAYIIGNIFWCFYSLWATTGGEKKSLMSLWIRLSWPRQGAMLRYGIWSNEKARDSRAHKKCHI